MATPRAVPLLIVISGPSGVGKDAVMKRLLERDSRLRRSITMTTRAPRTNDGRLEIDGVDYDFVTPEDFDAHVRAGDLLEHAGVHTSQYGSPRARVRALLDAGHDVILQVDVQGSLSLRNVVPGALFVYLAPESREILETRLRRRGMAEATVGERAKDRDFELDAARHFAHVLVNREGELEATVDAALALIGAERAREGRSAPTV